MPRRWSIALDGKTVRGARAGNEKAPHLLAAMICGTRAVIAQKDVDVKTNELVFRSFAGRSVPVSLMADGVRGVGWGPRRG